MPRALKPFYQQELVEAHTTMQKGYYQVSWRHLERAHILAQPYPLEHTIVHWQMLCFAVKIKHFKEVLGQVPRLMVGGIKSFVGKVPVGNTGGANVPPLQSMEIPGDLIAIIRDNKSR